MATARLLPAAELARHQYATSVYFDRSLAYLPRSFDEMVTAFKARSPSARRLQPPPTAAAAAAAAAPAAGLPHRCICRAEQRGPRLVRSAQLRSQCSRPAAAGPPQVMLHCAFFTGINYRPRRR